MELKYIIGIIFLLFGTGLIMTYKSLIGFAQLIFIYNVIYSYKYGEDADDNPWDGWSLEWATSSPPPHNSFVEIPTLKIAEEEQR